jgi:hypothetical protein
MFGNGRQMSDRQFPFAARTVLGALREDFGREHAVDFEKLELDRVATRFGGRIHEGKCARKVPAVIARRLCDETGGWGFVPGACHQANSGFLDLTISKGGLAKSWLTRMEGR